MMFDVLLKAMAKSIRLDENSFLNQMDGGVIATTFAMYPRCSSPDRVYGIHPHTDGSTITTLLPDRVYIFLLLILTIFVNSNFGLKNHTISGKFSLAYQTNIFSPQTK